MQSPHVHMFDQLKQDFLKLWRFYAPGYVRQCPATFFIVTTWGRGDATGIYSEEVRNAAKHPEIHSKVPYNQKLSGPKYQ